MNKVRSILGKRGRARSRPPGVVPAEGGPASPVKQRRGPKIGVSRVRLEQIRKEIQKGTYETEGKVRIAISRLVDDVFGRRLKRRH